MSSFVDTVRSLGPARLAMLGGVFLGLLIFFVFVSAQVSKPSLTLLYGSLSSIDSGAVAAKLDEMKIPFEVSTDGSQIRVPKNEIGRARMVLAQEGLPNGGSMGYEIFDQKNGFGTTSFVQNINQVRALQGELARTIATLDPVEFAKVHLVLPQRELFSRDTQEASGSVTLKLKPAARLSREQIYGIQNLVANAVPGLKAEHVTIIDTEANLLAGGNTDNSEAMAGAKADDMRRDYETRLQTAVEDMVGRIVGFNKVRAHVTADLNFDRIQTNSETYDPNGQVVRSSQTTEDNASETGSNAGGATGSGSVSVANNVPGGNSTAASGESANTSKRTEETTNYEISKTVQSVTRETGEVKKLSVAVLVDGAQVTDKDGKKTYQPRSQEELDKIASLVKSAIGYDATRGDTVEVVNMPFTEVDAPDVGEDSTLFGFDRGQLLQTAEMIMLAVMGILVILLVLKPIMTSLFQAQKAAIEEARSEMLLAQNTSAPALTGPSPAEMEARAQAEEDSLIDMQAVEGKVKASTVRKVGDIVTNHPNETVSIIRNWMTQE
ncbi:MAG: flagellar M-ring protein FliF [Rhodospirillales bacterium]|nr:flagellar M-ring protein FliF [Alphaproteobacteria bacterium]MCB9987118.1 flagellar M-ring protein FliF [Rhodospirillales bacterium]USO08562.1 MAG: flagellar M-ring protein FliF [Rhodospirillales bacterium]